MKSLNEKETSPGDLLVERINTHLNEIEFIIGIDQPDFSFDFSLNFYVKFKNKSYKDCQWISKKRLEAYPLYNRSLITPFKNKIKKTKLNAVPFVNHLYKPSDIIFKETFFNAVSILAHKYLEEDQILYLVQWQDLPITSATWETDVSADLIEIYNCSLNNPIPIQGQITDSFQDPENFIPIWESNVYKDNNMLTAYQINGYNWLIYKWHNNHNSILADERGIGKTIQSIAVIEGINSITNFRGPYLIIAPLQCTNKWEEELHKWTYLRVLNYTGDDTQLDMLNNYCLYLDSNRTELKCDVIITSFEIFKKRATDFNNIDWLCLFVDEIITQLIKNIQIVKQIPILSADHLILLTRTDVFSLCVEEIWCIFNLLEPDTFPSLEMFLKDFGESNNRLDKKKISNLAQDYILRRTSEILDPLKNKTSENDIVIKAEPTGLQMAQFKKLLLENRAAFSNTVSSNEGLLVQLRKISNHPFLFQNVFNIEIENYEKALGHKLTPLHEAKLIVESSGKMIVLDRLINRFQNLNKKVLVLSNMTAMIDLIETYLHKKEIPYERLSGSETSSKISYSKSSENSKNKIPTVYLSSINKNQTATNNADIAIIYDSHFTPKVEQKMVFRLLTRGTIEEDLYIRLVVEKNDSIYTEKDIDFIMRRNAHFAFNGLTDPCFITESLDKTLEYRTKLEFSFPKALNSSSFWVDLFSSQYGTIHFDSIELQRKDLKSIAKTMVNFGCYNAHKHLPKIEQLDFQIAVLAFVLYNSLDKGYRRCLKKYIRGVCSMSSDIVISKEMLKKDPLNDRQFVEDLFGNDAFYMMKKIFTYDRIYVALSYMATPAFNDVGFVFAQSMSAPTYWNEFYDYSLLYSLHKYGSLEADKEMVAKCMMDNSLNVPKMPSTEWLRQRVVLIICEMENIVPTDYAPSAVPLSPEKWIDSYRPKPNICFETRANVKKVLLGLYLFGFPIDINGSQLWPQLQKMIHFASIPLEVTQAIVYSLIKAASEFNSSLMELIQYNPIRKINVSWVKKNALISLSNQLIMFRKLRSVTKKNPNEILSPKFYINKWSIAPQWWDLECDAMLLETISSEGFLSLSRLMKMDRFKKLKQEDIEIIENESMIETEMMRPTLSQPLHELSFLLSIDIRISRINELCRILLSPSDALLSRQINSSQNSGLYIINVGELNNKGIPIGYIAKRFYRDEVLIRFLFFNCIVENDQIRNVPIFVIWNNSEGNRYVKVQAFSVTRAYKLLLEQLMKKSITLPPSSFDGYDFFGFKNEFVRYCIVSQNH